MKGFFYPAWVYRLPTPRPIKKVVHVTHVKTERFPQSYKAMKRLCAERRQRILERRRAKAAAPDDPEFW